MKMSNNDISGSYQFSNKDFVFGDDYYKLVIYAIPVATENAEDKKQLLYENVITNGEKVIANNKLQNIEISKLNHPTISVNEYNTTCNTSGCRMQFKPSIIDNDKVISNRKYYIDILDINYNSVIDKVIEKDVLSVNELITIENYKLTSSIIFIFSASSSEIPL